MCQNCLNTRCCILPLKVFFPNISEKLETSQIYNNRKHIHYQVDQLDRIYYKSLTVINRQVMKYGEVYTKFFTRGKGNARLFMHYGDNDAKIIFNVGEFQRSPERNENRYI